MALLALGAVRCVRDGIEPHRCDDATTIAANAKRAILNALQRSRDLLLNDFFIQFHRYFFISRFADASVVFTNRLFSRAHSFDNSFALAAKSRT
jgi:hypothetical protein